MDEATILSPPKRTIDARMESPRDCSPIGHGAMDLDALIASHAQQVARLVARLVDRPEDVEDLVQETFLAAVTHRHSFRGECQPSTWLARIAVNRCRSHYRRRRVRRLMCLSLSENGRATTENTHNTLENGEEVRRAVRRLSSKYREAVVLRYFENFSIDEMTQVLKLSRTAIEKRLSRAREKLKEILTPRLEKE